MLFALFAEYFLKGNTIILRNVLLNQYLFLN